MDKLIIRGAREHNLKNIDLDLPRDKLIVVSGLSGSGKSSLAFDTIFAEGQRRYVESLSAYARQFLGRMDKPDMDYIEGLSPAISIEQKTTHRNPRSTVGTVTEIYDYYRLLYARIGVPHCPKCGREIKEQSADQIIDAIMQGGEGTRIQILAPVIRGKKGEHQKIVEDARRAGFARARIDGLLVSLDDSIKLDKQKKHTIEIVTDRLVVSKEARSRLAESVETALQTADGTLLALVQRGADGDREGAGKGGGVAEQTGAAERSDGVRTVERRGGSVGAGVTKAENGRTSDSGALPPYTEYFFSQKNACPECGVSMPELQPRMFSFNNPFGACPECDGLGVKLEFDPALLVPDPSLSFNEGGLATHNPDSAWYRSQFESLARHYRFSLDTPFAGLPKNIWRAIMYGGDDEVDMRYQNREGTGHFAYKRRFPGILEDLKRRYMETQSEGIKDWLEKFMSQKPCEACGGRRLKPEALAVTVGGRNIYDVSSLAVNDTLKFFDGIEFTPTERQIAGQILREITARLGFLKNVGLEYLSLERKAGTLSGGEAQRIRLATQIGSSLVGVLYILDEPSIGLHQRDNQRLIDTLLYLRDLGNTLIVVEHDEQTLHTADYLVDLGPGAGVHGGAVVAQGTPAQVMKVKESLTGQYLAGVLKMDIPAERRRGNGHFLRIKGAADHNLKNISVEIPLGVFTCITGVSGSGKSTLLSNVLYPALANAVYGGSRPAGAHKKLEGAEFVDKVIDIDQSPIGRTPRSNPATYVGVFGGIRDLFATLPEAKARGYKPGRFSFNV
ncbi:MAG: excinuclease ABC subunit UvrA, partial [Spirochaetaceae bacterium]|nr:excinuclease ABC subunit UvrA [Spirochaetaceae bacterium]